jgi:hypothetical protein
LSIWLLLVGVEVEADLVAAAVQVVFVLERGFL